ncbi:MAG: GNAT family N-acetyltransferase [Verrucomicrobiota bacterium]
MTGFRSEPLASRHQRSGFSCGEPVLDDYLRSRASQDMRRYSAAVFVLVPESDPLRIAGYYTLSAFSIELDSLPAAITKHLARYSSVPALLIGRLARDLSFPGLGGILLADALARCARQAEEIGASLIVVEAKNAVAKRFYEKHGFHALESHPTRLVLPMRTVRSLLPT